MGGSVKHPLDMVIASQVVLDRAVVDTTRFTYPMKVPVIPTGPHPPLHLGPTETHAHYCRNGHMARRVKAKGGTVVYRLPWRYWRYRRLNASGDWRRSSSGDAMTLVGIALIPALSSDARSTTYFLGD